MNENNDTSSSSYTSLVNAYVNAIPNISSALASIGEVTKKITESLKPMLEVMASISQAIAKSIPKDYFRGLAEVIQEAYNNPHSLINYSTYEEKLDNFHWAWPHGFEAEEIKRLVETVGNEKEFDSYMAGYFSSGKDTLLMDETLAKLPRRQKVIFKQIIKSYDRKDYAIANNALMSIIDNTLAYYLKNPGQVRRHGLLHPIVNLWSGAFYNTAVAFRLMMLSHNIDFIFEEYNFANKIVIETNKKARRHPAVHGFRYSNQKIDTLMLVNTLQELLTMKDVLQPFVGALILDKVDGKSKVKAFRICDDKARAIYRPIIKEIIIESLKNQPDGLSHDEIMKELRFRLGNEVVTPQYISGILQSMKKANGQIHSCKNNGTTKWLINENISLHE